MFRWSVSRTTYERVPTLPVPTTRNATSWTLWRASSGRTSGATVARYGSRDAATAAAGSRPTSLSTGGAAVKRHRPCASRTVDLAANRAPVLFRALAETFSSTSASSWASATVSRCSSATAFQASRAGSLASARMVRR